MSEIPLLRRSLFGLVAAAYPATALLAAIFGLRIDYPAHLSFVAALLGLLAVLSLYCRLRGMEFLRRLGEPVCALLLLTLPILVSTYIAMRVNRPEADALLAGLDRSIGFNWMAFVAAIDARAWLSTLLFLSYESFAYQLLLLPPLLVLCGQAARAYRMVIAYGLICFSSSLIGMEFPALGAYPFFRVAPETLPAINLHFGYFFLDQFHQVRSDPNFVFSLRQAAGILTFPSVHAGVATLCLWAAWRLPVLNLAFLVLNVAMALSAISHGSHYLVDIVAGIALAASCVVLVRRLGRVRTGAVSPLFSEALATPAVAPPAT